MSHNEGDRIRAGTRTEVERARVLVVPLPPDHDGEPREAIVLFDREGKLRAFLNRCRHLPIPLDAGARRFLDKDGSILCATHGALYRPEDGYCYAGPCRGLSLRGLALDVDDAGVIWIERA